LIFWIKRLGWFSKSKNAFLGAENNSRMARTVIVTVCWVAIVVACIDDSIAARTVTMDDDYAAALDNDYLSVQPTTPHLVERQMVASLGGSNSTSLEIPRRAAAAAIAAHFRSLPRDVSPLIMRC
jgi:hypothetical protein